MQYRLIERNEKHVAAISRALKKARRSCWRPTRTRGEAIAGTCTRSCANAASSRAKSTQRVVFHEITRNAIREAVTHPRELSLTW